MFYDMNVAILPKKENKYEFYFLFQTFYSISWKFQAFLASIRDSNEPINSIVTRAFILSQPYDILWLIQKLTLISCVSRRCELIFDPNCHCNVSGKFWIRFIRAISCYDVNQSLKKLVHFNRYLFFSTYCSLLKIWHVLTEKKFN